jgi:hypothetical protein
VPNWLSGAEDCAPRTQLIPWSSVSAAFALVLDPNSSSSSSNNAAAANGHSSAAKYSAAAASAAQHTISAPQTLDTSSGSSSGFAVGKLQAFSCAPSSPQQTGTAIAAAAAASNGFAAGLLHTDSAAAAAAPGNAATAAAAVSALQTAGSSDSMRGIAAPQFWLVGSRQHEVSAYCTTCIAYTAALSLVH